MNRINLIEKTISENIKNINTVFIFPTQTSADLWADRTTVFTDVKAVAMERYIAWDDFKGTSIRSQNQNKTSIPSTMRKIFTTLLIEENAASPFLKNLITKEYASSASGFTNWINSILPGLSMWKKYFENKNLQPDEEDQDLLEIYNRYNSFLEKHNLFDPAWETPPFKNDGNKYIIFFPEILSDWGEYKEILESTEDIELIHLNSAEYKNDSVEFFNNSRIELTNIALKIRQLHEEKNIPWTEIALSVPDLENYGPYIDRELSLYQIPHVMRMSSPLTSTCAGVFFKQVQECVSSKFSFNSMKNLLLNKQLPWITSIPAERFIGYGQENNCLCSYKSNGTEIDIWKKSLSFNYDAEVEAFYKDFSSQLKHLAESKTFAEIRENYFIFRNNFFNMEECPEKSDRIISRCITELGGLIDLELQFQECMISNPYNFFVSYLDDVSYLEQASSNGVTVLPYKTAATSPFDCHIVMDASQKGLSVIYKELSFLRDDKRELLFGKNFEDTNVSEEYIQLYSMNSLKENVIFTCSSKTFTDYAQPSSYLTEIDLTKKTASELLNAEDYFSKEKDFILNGTPQLTTLTNVQKEGFNFWKSFQDTKSNLSENNLPQTTLDLINNAVENRRIIEGKVDVSPTSLRTFFACPQKWVFQSLSRLDEESSDAQLMDSRTFGNFYHRVFELFLMSLKEHNLQLHTEKGNLSDEYNGLLSPAVKQALNEAKQSFLAGELLATSETSLFYKVKKSVETFLTVFDGCSVIGCEEKFTHDDNESGIRYTGKIDCLLKDNEHDELILIDFKTYRIKEKRFITEEYILEVSQGNIPLVEQDLPDFQIPFYIYLLRNQKNPVHIENAAFFNVNDNSFQPVTGCESFAARFDKRTQYAKSESFEFTIEKMLECTQHYTNALKEKNFSVNAAAQDYHTCNDCFYKAICRRTFTVGKKD